MKRILFTLATAIIFSSCTDPKVQEDLKKLREDHEELKKSHEDLKSLVKDAVKAEVRKEDQLEGSKID